MFIPGYPPAAYATRRTACADLRTALTRLAEATVDPIVEHGPARLPLL